MQQFFMEYGLYLLIALMIGIAVIFLMTRGKKGSGAIENAPPSPAKDAHAVPAATGAPDALVVPDPAPVVAMPPLPLAETAVPAQDHGDEPTVPPPPPSAASAPAPVESVAQAAPSEVEDDLLRLKGVGPKLKTQLTQLGVTRFAQIAAWTDSDIAVIDAQLGAFKGRPVRDQWVDQAKYLAAGDIAGFEAKYGKI